MRQDRPSGHSSEPRGGVPSDAERLVRYENRRRRRRRRATIALLIASLLVGAWLTVAHSRLTRRLVIPRIEAMLNATVEGGDVSIGIDGLVTIRNAQVRVPGVPGAAGIVFEAKRINARPSWSRLLGLGGAGAPVIKDVELIEPLLRFSQSVDDGSMNIAALDLPSPTGASGVLPTVVVRGGLVELGEHSIDSAGRARYAVLRRLDVDGTVSPSRDLAKGEYRIAVQQVERTDTPPRPDVPRPRLLDIQGTVSSGGVSITMSDLELNDWPASAVPTRLRSSFQTLGLQGRVRRTRLDFDDRDGLRAEMELEDVAVNLPIDATEEPLEGPRPPEPPARMRSVNGTVRFLGTSVEADLNGLLEDLPYKVRLKYLGLTPDAAFECDLVCENFRMEEKPQILRFAPPLVRYRLAQFSNPTGLVTARALVTRARPEGGRPADVRVKGTLEFSDVTAAYWSFPYRFHGIKGFVTFDDRTLDIVSLEGGTPNGARLSASAHISPLTDAAGAHIEVRVMGVPIDERLGEAMGPRRKLIEEIASADQHRRLVERGAFLSPERRRVLQDRLAQARLAEAAAAGEETRRGARAEIAAIEASLRTPEFSFRGSGDVSIVIDRREGNDSIWTEIIDVRLGKVGLLPDRFPLPINSENVRVLIDGETVRVEGGTYRGLGGGEATVTASMLYPTIENPDLDPLPQAHIEARGIPLDGLLTHAVGGAVDRATRQSAEEPETDSASFVRAMLSGLRLSGTVDAVTDLVSDATGTHVNSRARSVNLGARPERGGESVEILASESTVTLTDSQIDVAVAGRVTGRSPGEDAGMVTLGARVTMSRTESSAWTADVRATGLDLAEPIEAAVGVFSEPAAERSRAVRESTRLSGRADVAAVLSGGPGGLAGEITSESLRGVELDALGGRVALNSTGGRLRFTPFREGREDAVRFESFRADASGDGGRLGEIALDGEVTGLGTARMNGTLRAELLGATFQHPTVRRLAREHGGAGLRDVVERVSPEGDFDAEMSFVPGDEGIVLKRAVLRPRSLALTLESGRAWWPEFSGTIEFEPGAGMFRGLRARSEAIDGHGSWEFGADGSWVVPSAGALAVRADVSVEAQGVPPGLRAVLPAELTGAMDELNFKAEGGVRVERATVTYNDDGTSAGRSVRVEGGVEFDRVALEAGVPVTDCRGTIDFSVDRPAGAAASYDLWGVLPSFRLSGLAMTDGRLRLSGGGASGAVLVPVVSADCYGGRASGRMSVRPGGPGGARRYDAEMKLSGVRFAPVLRDLSATSEPPEDGDAVALDDSRGRLDASVSLAGVVGDAASRRGRGSATIGGGAVMRMPLLLPLIQFSNLQLPFEERLRLAVAEFFITGETLVFEDVSAFSDSVRIFGYGTATWPGLDLNLRFSSRAMRRVPVLSGILEGIRDELASTSVSGTLREPKISTTPLGGTAQMLDSIFGTQDEQARMMKEIERRSIEGLDRVRTTGERSAKGVVPSGGR